MPEDSADTNIQVDDREIGRINALHVAKSREKQIDMGLIGRLFGSVSEKPGNIAGLIVLASFLLLTGILFCYPDSQSLSKKDALAIVAGFITLGLGFLFGRSSN
jgi:hypothetical protein